MAAINDSYESDEGENKSTNNHLNNCQERIIDSGNGERQDNRITINPEPDEHMSTFHSTNFVSVGLETFWEKVNNLFERNSQVLKKTTLQLLGILFIVYVAAVFRQFQLKGQPITDWCKGYGLAFIFFTLVIWAIVYYTVLVPYIFTYLQDSSCFRFLKKSWRKLRIGAAVTLAIGLVAFIVWDTSTNRRRLLSFCGLLTFIFVGFILSKYPSHVRWQTVFSGLLIQFAMGLLAIRWTAGRQMFKCVGDLAETFLEYSYIGASMVFGDLLVRKEHVFAFQALSAMFFVSMIVQVLFYMGWMQVFCLKLGWLIQTAMGTTIMESVNAVSSVFLGMTEAPMLYRPYIKDLTPSEIHAVMVGGFSTIAGTVFAAYASFGVDPAYIITAALMSAPAALCFAKLTFPETMKTKTDVNSVQMYKSEDMSVMDAAVQGALSAINIVQGIIATVIACVSFIAFFNEFVAWLGLLVGVSDFTLETILSYILYPVVWMMGVEPSQCLDVARLIGIKISVNEFLAYRRLGEMKKAGILSVRTEAMATFALCSFANPGSLGILISTLTTMCPSQRENIIQLSIRALVCSIVVTFLTACIAGTLMPEEGF